MYFSLPTAGMGSTNKKICVVSPHPTVPTVVMYEEAEDVVAKTASGGVVHLCLTTKNMYEYGQTAVKSV